jgi:hypothetical protein
MIARDFNSPLLWMRYLESPSNVPNPDIEAERAWVYQIAMENQVLPFLWTRCSIYRSENRDAIGTVVDTTQRTEMAENFAHRRRQGGEVELKVLLPNGLSAFASGAFNDVRELPSDASFWSLSEGEAIKARARVVYNLGLGYRGRGTEVNLSGNYVWWNAPDYYEAKDKRFIWDMKLSHRIQTSSMGSLGVFAAAHNLLDTEHALMSVYPGLRRWFEGGLNYSF